MHELSCGEGKSVRMIEMRVSLQGIITSVKGQALPDIYRMNQEEMEGLPYHVLHEEQIREGVQTLFIRQRTGEVIPVQIAAVSESEGWKLWIESLFGDKRDELRLNYLETAFKSIAYVAEYGDPDLSDHLSRVASYTRFLAESLGWTPMDVKRIEIASLVHDVGKTAIPRELLFKPGHFLREERKYMEQHTERGHLIIEELESRIRDGWMIDRKLFELARNVTLYHHENWDGSGYPSGRKEVDIPQESRLVRVVDAIDALLSFRVYKQTWPWERAKDELLQYRGSQFDAEIVDNLLKHEDAFLKVAQKMNTRLSGAVV